MQSKLIPAIFEAGKLRPLEPLDLNEHERVEVAIVRAMETSTDAEDDYQPAFIAEADTAVTLEQVHQALAKLPGSLLDDFSREREERF